MLLVLKLWLWLWHAVINTVRLGVLLPVSGAWPVGGMIAGALSLAIDAVNTNALLGEHIKLAYVWRDAGCEANEAMASLSVMLDRDGPIHAVVGPGCSMGCESTAYLSAGLELPHISFSCASDLLSNRETYPTFVRTSPSYSSLAPMVRILFRWARWARLACISSTPSSAVLPACTASSHLPRQCCATAPIF